MSRSEVGHQKESKLWRVDVGLAAWSSPPSGVCCPRCCPAPAPTKCHGFDDARLVGDTENGPERRVDEPTNKVVRVESKSRHFLVALIAFALTTAAYSDSTSTDSTATTEAGAGTDTTQPPGGSDTTTATQPPATGATGGRVGCRADNAAEPKRPTPSPRGSD